MRYWLIASALWLGLWGGGSVAAPTEVTIGVLSHRGGPATLRHWGPTADYLSQELTGYRFKVRPLGFEQVDEAVARGEVDFVLVNSGIYVQLELRYGVARIATLNNRLNGVAYNSFGGVIFTRADRTDIAEVADLRGQRFMAVDATSLGGYQMAWRELKRHHFDPREGFSELRFGGTHDAVVMAVKRGEVDVGTVRTNILERMASEGLIDYNSFRILLPRTGDGFPFVHSTRLYPEWPFAKTRRTPNVLAQAVSVALLSMPVDHPAALAGRYAGWTVPLDYQPVHELFKELHLGPYTDLGRVTVDAVVREYGDWLATVLVLVFLLLFALTHILRLNQRLSRAKEGIEREYALILDAVGDGIVGVDMQGNATFINAAMERITGWGVEDLVGANLHDMLHHTRLDGSPHPSKECPVYATFRDNEPNFIDDDIFWRKDGSHFHVEYLSTPLRDRQGAIIGAVVVFRDITARLQGEEEARQHQAELAHVARLNTMGEMASGIAHELNQPLSAITNYTNGCIRMVRGGRVEPEQLVDVLQVVSDQARRAGEIIRQLRNFVRKEGPKQGMVDINEVVRSVAVLIKPEVRRSGVALVIHLDNDLGPIHGYPIQLEQVMLNLMRNAIDAMEQTPVGERHLEIRTVRSDTDQVSVSVTDTGQGLGEADIERIFDPFVTTKPQGMGLGLSISQGIVYSHGGQLIVCPNQGPGVTFRFNLPIAEEQPHES